MNSHDKSNQEKWKSAFDKEKLLRDFYDYKAHLLRFLRHPLEEIQTLPDWDWQKLITFQILLSAATGVIGGFTEKKIIFSIFFGLFISPIIIFVSIGIATLFFYYAFQIFVKKTIAWRSLFTLILFANIPLIIFRIISAFFPPITLFGLAFAAALLVIGFVLHFGIEKKRALQLVVSLYALFFVTWLYSQINTSRQFDRSWSPEKIEAPEVELGK